METATPGQTIKVNGIEMYFETRGRGEPLVLLHGGGGIGDNWRLIFGETPAGFQLIVPDMRGHGRSTNPSGEFTFRQCALDVFALLDHLGVGQFKAVGMSLGAKTLLHMATEQPARAEAMVLVSAAPYFPAETRALMREFSAAEHTEAEWRQMREWHKHGDEQIRALWRLGDVIKDNYTDMNFTPPLLSTINARTLIVHGDRDPLYPVSLATEMYAAIPRSYLWVVPNGGHGPVFGALAERFAETSLAFLRGEWVSGP
ncbi:MAG: alpha/beta hydrolase [Acidobacteriota bacterium]|nr:alpha/beta hydrolase [Acidobacteriota bacterium]MDQ5835527.1 alpha/beta hydrolase [Acidobacteriota bacterium]